MDEVLRQLAAVDADDAPFAVATIVVAVLAALVLGPGDPAVFGKRGEIEARGQEQREGDHSSFSSCTGISRGSMGTKLSRLPYIGAPQPPAVKMWRSCAAERRSSGFALWTMNASGPTLALPCTAPWAMRTANVGAFTIGR